MQQKYGAALAGKAPDVVEAQIADKGTYHRLVVGPPASREAAAGVCTQLKAAGYTASCWVTAF
jgi:cell division septation protein DedD